MAYWDEHALNKVCGKPGFFGSRGVYGASVGGIVFSPLWVTLITGLGFALAAALIATAMVLSIWVLAERVLARTPAHLFSILVPALGAHASGLAMGLVTVMAIAGRTVLGWWMPLGADRRLAACIGYALQLAGSAALLLAAGANVPLLLAGVMLFGIGFGNATSRPPLIAQVEFVENDVARVAALIVAIAQSGYAFAPALFGLVGEWVVRASGNSAGAAGGIFTFAALIQLLAIGASLAGRTRASSPRAQVRIKPRRPAHGHHATASATPSPRLGSSVLLGAILGDTGGPPW